VLILFNTLISGRLTIFGAVVLAGISFWYASFAYAETLKFRVDGSFDWDGRGEVNATLRHEGINGKFYVADDYWNSLGFRERDILSADVEELSNQFDTVIYPGLVSVFGSENKPGVDGNSKITVLMTKMIDGAGGYFREQDGFLKSLYADSNEREMVYLNAAYSYSERMRSFLAHEFQHLITFNQKTIKHNVQEEVWLNELRSEIAPTLVGYDGAFVYTNSNLEARTKSFMKNFSDAILNWEAEEKDYASINLFGQYVLDHYGRSVIASMTENNLVGIESFNAALRVFGFSEEFADVYTNWTIANLVNSCEVEPINTYCYNNPNLKYSDIHVTFSGSGVESDTVSSERSTEDWRSFWFEFETGLKNERPADHIFRFDFFAPQNSKFRVPYVTYGSDGLKVKETGEIEINSGSGSFYIKNFGFDTSRIVIIPSNQAQYRGGLGRGNSTRYNFNAATITDFELSSGSTTLPFSILGGNEKALLPNLADGTLIRASNDYKVYVINGRYKRWIQSAEIFNFYGHFSFAAVSEVSPETLDLYEDSWLVRADSDTKVYEINGDGTRHWLDMSAEEFLIRGRKWDMVRVINTSELNWYVEGPAVR